MYKLSQLFHHFCNLRRRSVYRKHDFCFDKFNDLSEKVEKLVAKKIINQKNIPELLKLFNKKFCFYK